jgi:hypothetical protein
VCNSRLEVRRYQCPECEITIEGRFGLSEFSGLSLEQQEFVKTFICCQGNIREVERALGISYPTVKNRLQQIRTRLCGRDRAVGGEVAEDSMGILSELESGRITVEEALKKLGKE